MSFVPFNPATPFAPTIPADSTFKNILVSNQSAAKQNIQVPTPVFDLDAANKLYVDTHGGGGTPALPLNQIFVGNASNAATAVTMTGDTSIAFSNLGPSGIVTIANNAITTSKIADANVTDIKLSNTTVVSNTYGSNNQVPQFHVDAKGRLTSAVNIPIDAPSATLPSGDIYIGNASNVATAVAMSGDATVSNTGVLSISNNAITTSKIANSNVTSSKLVDTGVIANTYGSNNQVPQFTVNSKGQLTSAVNVTIDAPSATLPSGDIYVGNGSNVATAVAMSGDATLDNTGLLTLANTGVVAGSYGTSIAVPVFTTDSKGRLMLAANLAIQDASGVQSGVVNTGIQTFAGTKTFSTVNANLVTGLAAPTANTDATNKLYVDGLVNGYSWTIPVNVVSVAPITLSGLPQTIDGILLVGGERVLVVGQGGGQGIPDITNGIYDTSAGAWTRSADMPTGTAVFHSASFITQGLTYESTAFVCNTPSPNDIIDTNPVSWVQFAGFAAIEAGNALTKIGNFLNVNVDNIGIEIAGNNLQLKDDGVTTAKLSDTTVVPGSYGSSTQVPTFTVDSKGRLTAAANTTVSGIPTGGLTGQLLAKISNTNYDADWVYPGLANTFAFFNENQVLNSFNNLTVNGPPPSIPLLNGINYTQNPDVNNSTINLNNITVNTNPTADSVGNGLFRTNDTFNLNAGFSYWDITDHNKNTNYNASHFNNITEINSNTSIAPGIQIGDPFNGANIISLNYNTNIGMGANILSGGGNINFMNSNLTMDGDFQGNSMNAMTITQNVTSNGSVGYPETTPVLVIAFNQIDLVAGGLPNINGQQLIVGDRVLLVNGSTANPGSPSIDNGIYLAQVGSWIRSADMPNGTSTFHIATYATHDNQTQVANTPSPNDIIGTDPIQWNGTGVQMRGYAYYPSIQNGSTIGNLGINSYDSNIQLDENCNAITGYQIGAYTNNGFTGAPKFYTGFNSSMNCYGTTLNYTGVAVGSGSNFNDNLKIIQDFNGVACNCTSNITNSFNGLNLNINLQNPLQNFNGVFMNPQITDVQNATGIFVDMSNVHPHVGTSSTLTIGTLVYTSVPHVTSNNIFVEYLNAGGAVPIATLNQNTPGPGQATVSVSFLSGLATENDIKNAVNASVNASSAVVVTGGSGAFQSSPIPSAPLTGGSFDGNVKAAFFNGDVQIQGSLQFSGALNIGQLNSFSQKDLANGPGPGQVATIDSLITQMNGLDNTTYTNADTLGVNTASIMNIGTNTHVTTSFIGLSALGLPAVLGIGPGSTVDRVSGATFALALQSSPGAGTVDEVDLCNAFSIPDGNTTVTKLKAYNFEFPFGPVGTTIWGIYMKPDCNNFLKGSLRIGGTSGSDDTVSSSGIGLELMDKHISSRQTTAPTIVAVSGTGSLSNATDIAGIITMTSAAATVGLQATITFNSAYAIAPIIQLTPRNSVAGLNAISVYVNSTTTTFTINAASSVGAASYQWFYNVIQTN